MDSPQNLRDTLIRFLAALPAVQSVIPYGSFATGQSDEYSDIDLALDVSGCDNGEFLLILPQLLQKRYPVLYTDFAPSLAPDKYILTAALFPEHPFLLADISVTAEPHYATVTKEMLTSRNALYSHTLKLFTANLKHYLRGTDCGNDIRKMYGRLPLPETERLSEMLFGTHQWLLENGTSEMRQYAEQFRPFLNRIS